MIVAAIVVLAVIFAWGKTEQKSNTMTIDDTTVTEEELTDLSDAGKLGPNEIAITAANFETEVIQGSAGKLVVVDVYAPWCPHCQKMGPITTALSDEFAGKVKFGKMNADNQDSAVEDNFNFAIDKGMEGYPTYWFYKDGKLVYSFSGEKTQDEFRTQIEKYL